MKKVKFVVQGQLGQEVDMTCGRRVNHQKRHHPVYLAVAATTKVVAVMTLIGSERTVRLVVGSSSSRSTTCQY